MKRFLKVALLGAAFFVSLPILYFLASLIGGLVPGVTQPAQSKAGPKPLRIYLITSPLHADIALPFNQELLLKFPQLQKAGLPLDHPNLKYLTFGWGSRAFYTTAGTYSDIEIGAVLRAITGDEAVMRVTAAGDLSTHPDVVPLGLDKDGYNALLRGIATTFDEPEAPGSHLRDQSIGPNDAFFRAKGHFNIFNPCNQWVNTMLSKAGYEIGSWTPTTQSLKLSLGWHQSSARQE